MVVKLEEFDAERRDAWCDKWNSRNQGYFRDHGIRPFAVPNNAKLLELARQPLLLLMLAIYDSLGNELSSQPDIDQTLLYDRLLRRFIERELSKGKAGREFVARRAAEREHEVNREMDRLGVAAIGMFSRQDVKIGREDLNADLRYFDRQKGAAADGRALAEADLLLGSFFFIHESRSRLQQEATGLGRGTAIASAAFEHAPRTRFQTKPSRSDTEAAAIGSAAFEFLHNTFGEFLAADFILRRTLEEAATICKLTGDPALAGTRSQRLAMLSEAWFGALLHTPLHTRPVILTMLREWGRHRLAGRQRSGADTPGGSQPRTDMPGGSPGPRADMPVGFQWSRADILAALDAIVAAQLRVLLNDLSIPDPDPRQRALSPYPSLPQRGHLAIYSLNLVLLRTYLGDVENGGDGGAEYVLDETALGDWPGACRPWDSLASLWRGWFTLDSLGEVAQAFTATRHEDKIAIAADRSELAQGMGSPLNDLYSSAVALADSTVAASAGLHVAPLVRMPESLFGQRSGRSSAAPSRNLEPSPACCGSRCLP